MRQTSETNLKFSCSNSISSAFFQEGSSLETKTLFSFLGKALPLGWNSTSASATISVKLIELVANSCFGYMRTDVIFFSVNNEAKSSMIHIRNVNPVSDYERKFKCK